MKKQKFRRESEDLIDLAGWDLPKLEEKLGSIEILLKEAVGEVLQLAIEEKASIDFNVLLEEGFDDEKNLLKKPDVDRMMITLPFGDGWFETEWSINLTEEVKYIINKHEEMYSFNEEDIKEDKIRLKVLSGVFKLCAQMLDDSVNKKWD
jgi:hypothetical protein